MHFITGGSFHGKKQWAIKYAEENGYKVDSVDSLFETEEWQLPQEEDINRTCYVVEGLEMMVRNRLLRESVEDTTNYLSKKVEDLLNWERHEGRQVFLIASDITKGIVPIERTDRQWRDVTGLLLQYIAKHAERVDVVWYGLNQQLK